MSSDPFAYLWECPGSVDGSGISSTDHTYEIITAPSTTASDDTEGVPTPSTSTRTLAWLDDDSHAANTNQLAGIQSPAGTLLPPEPAVLLAEICKAAEDVAQLVGRFGPKMAGTLAKPRIMAALFQDHNQLRLPSLRYADCFTCRRTEPYAKPGRPRASGEEPLLWWLWDALLMLLDRSGTSTDFTFKFTPARNTDMALPYEISIKLKDLCNIEMTAKYGGSFNERRIFDADIAIFRPHQPVGFDETPPAVLAVDETPYTGDGNYGDALDYLMPRTSIWRSAMEITSEKQVELVTALAGTCKAEDDWWRIVVTEYQDSQCKNLLRRLPPRARKFIEEDRLVGKESGCFSKMWNRPEGPKS
ncbi:uncharacterized protein Triagg1_3301 [Trichoderma aggressivum f. europaeum]|uniref:Uncharacterized protein n=1 Tax=Trichoderma aggressivum f. europaeum TaxID=173218 RepID=A0AAE1IHJ8_9HYPO|nr:hypothetical protein Triagg1_3301 [Trichoderma aggressivum f. europaeum]